MSRLKLVSDAVRPKMHGRVMLAGPPGAGKSWSALSIARHLVGPEGKILAIDTERESLLTYADVFIFQHLPWRPPYDPTELTSLLLEIQPGYTDCIIIDSGSHFWRGIGGTLDIAGSKAQGWAKARPIQEALIEALVGVPCHLIFCVRSKMGMLIEDGGKSVTQIGMEAIQDDQLAYEVNISLSIERDHKITVEKSRTPAVPVGRQYPAGYETKLAEDYNEWLEGGIPPANREDVDAIVAMFSGIADRDQQIKLKKAFVAEFGMPHALVAAQVEKAREWLIEQGSPVGEGPAATSHEPAPSEAVEPVSATTQPEVSETVPTAPVEGNTGDLDSTVERSARVTAYCMGQDIAIVEAVAESQGMILKLDEPEEKVRVWAAQKLVMAKWDPDVSDQTWRQAEEPY